MKTKAVKLIPPNKKQCQAEKPNGNTFMTLGGIPGRVRCTNKPFVIVIEREPNPQDGMRGSMSMCPECFAVFKEQNDITNYKLRAVL